MRKVQMRTVAVWLCLALSFVVLSGCPPPITNAMLFQIHDQLAPDICLLCPEPESYYPSVLLVSGTVTDDSAVEGDRLGGVGSLSWEILGTDLSGEIPSPEETFAFTIATHSLDGMITLRMTAVDWSGNPTSQSLTLLDGGSGIPSLTVVSGNGEVSLQWDEIPGAETYTLYYTTDNSYPNLGHGGTNGFELADVDPGLTLPDLQNGAMHVFQLRAEIGDALPDAWSDFVQALPLSEFSLAPRVSTAVPDQIEIFWKSIPADVPFVLYRSDSADGTYYQLTEPIYGTSYVDWNVTDGQVYYYRIAPLAYSDTMSLAAAGTTGLIPNESLVSSTTPTEYSACSVWIEGNYAYVSSVGGWLLIFDIGEVDNPTLEGKVNILSIYPPPSYTGPLPPNIVGVAVYEDYAFLGNWTDDSIYVIDVSSAEDPVVRGSFLTENGPMDIDVYGHFLISLEYDYISAFDIEDVASWLPAEPAQFSYPCSSREDFQDHSAKPLRGSCMDIDAASGMTYIGTMHRTDPFTPQTMHVVVENVNDEGTLTWVAESTDLDCDAMADIAVSDDGAALYVAMGPYGVQVMDSSTLALVDEIDSQGTAVGVNAVGDSLYVVGLGSGLEVYDIPDPLDPDPLPTRIFESNTSCHIKAHPVYDNGFIFYPDLVSGLQRIYVLDDFLYDDPAETGLYSLYPATSNNKAFDVAVTENRAYLAEGLEGVRVFDVTDCTSPISIGSFPASGGEDGYVVGVDTVGDYVFLIDTGAGLKIVDAHDPENMIDVGTYPHLPFLTWPLEYLTSKKGVVVFGDHAYVAGFSEGLLVVDISHPDAPVLAVQHITRAEAYDVEIRDDIAFVAVGTAGVDILDITDPADPREIGHVATPGVAYALAVAGNMLYVADEEEGVQVVDITSPGSPVLVGSYRLPWWPFEWGNYDHANDIAVTGDYAIVAFGDLGYQILDVSDPARIAVVGPTSADDDLDRGDNEIYAYGNGIDLFGDRVYLACGWYHITQPDSIRMKCFVPQSRN